MGDLAPFSENDRIATAESIKKTSESVYEIAKKIDRANEELDDLNEGLKILASKHEVYKVKAAKAKKLMRNLTSEL